MMKPTISIILPALNEEEAINKVIKEIPRRELEDNGYSVQVLIIDNGSTDNTKAIAEQNGATVISEQRRGKGYAVNTGLEAVDSDYVFLLDSDYTYPPEYVIDMLKLLRKYPVVIGSRIKGHREKGSIRFLSLIGNIVLSFMASVIYQRWISDVCTGFWGLRREVVKNMNLKASGFEIEARLFSEIAKKGYSIGELPINYRKRTGGRTKLQPFQDGVKIAKTLLFSRFNK